MKKLSSIFVSALLFGCLHAQDPHFSQFYMTPLYLNPSLTGAFDGNYRLTALFRGQWGSILRDESVPMFRTYTASADFRTNKGFLKGDAFGFGASFMGDQAGESRFGFYSGGLSIAYHKALNSRATNFLAAGFSSGIYQQMIDFSRLQFGSQWDGNAYNALLPTNEFLVNNRFLYWDINAGLLWYMKIAKRTNVYLGASAFHLNRPGVSFLGDKDVRLNMKFVGHGGVRFPLKGRFDMQPKFITMFQGKSVETILATDFRMLFEERYPEGNHLRFGAMMRMVGGDPNAPWRDQRINAESVILNAGVVFNGLEIGAAYDINVSQLISGSRGRGGFEVAVAYVGAWKRRGPQTIYCPRF
ncbi:MAG: PorP/SprF family type IX secretion system membrane protein [Chitinophagales bacterium]|nr:PorP/SprF family type IX secretion system membrane protein [Chitinophagales bacterium]MDW8419386.1 PorP/SprF family type IX secretion system membrane protein [Chitinophagales bacterium]